MASCDLQELIDKARQKWPIKPIKQRPNMEDKKRCKWEMRPMMVTPSNI